jgi:hypothetical protein
MLYCLAVEGNERWLAPKAVVDMSDRQAARSDFEARWTYLERILKPGAKAEGSSWLATNSREGIRDEALRTLKEIGAVIERTLPKSSSRGRYALALQFAELFDPERSHPNQVAGWSAWRDEFLSPEELARLAIGATQASNTVHLPDGTTASLSHGPSQAIIRAVIEGFAVRFLEKPAVLAYSDSSAPVSYINKRLMTRISLRYKPGDPLPDVVLADISHPMRLVFVEAVATEGPMDAQRIRRILSWLERTGYGAGNSYFVTAYLNRDRPEFRKTIGQVAWGSAVWFVAEPDNLVVMLPGAAAPKHLRYLSDL